MNLEEVKENILNNKINNSVIIFKCSENTFIATQYVREIAKKKSRTIENIESIESLKSLKNSFFSDDNLIYLIKDENVEINDDLSTFENLYIICKTFDTSFEDNNKLIVDVPKLIDWQIEDYIKAQLNLNDKNTKTLMLKKDIYAIQNEIDKIAIFDSKYHNRVFEMILKDNEFIDFDTTSIFTFTNAFLKKDLATIYKVLKNVDNIDVEPAGVVTLLVRNFRYIIDMQMNPNSSAKALGISDKQFNAIKYNCNKYSNAVLINIFEMLNDIDYRLKSGELDYDKIIDYITINILSRR